METGAKIVKMTMELSDIISFSSKELLRAKDSILLSSMQVMLMDVDDDKPIIIADLRDNAVRIGAVLEVINAKLKELMEM